MKGKNQGRMTRRTVRVRIRLFSVVNFNKSINKSVNVKEMGGSFVSINIRASGEAERM